MRQIAVVTPVFDDWGPLRRLITEMNRLYRDAPVRLDVLAVDDGSGGRGPDQSLAPEEPGAVRRVRVLRLAANMGHQRAIAVGLTRLAEESGFDAVIVMDSDGEDRPEDIGRLLESAALSPGAIVLAKRSERSESRSFRLGYACYKRLFRLLTGQEISFGNFALLPREAARRLVFMPELWNHLAASVMRSRIPYVTVPTRRGRRYMGRSRMNLPMLVLHGLSAISVYSDIVFVRMLVGAGAIMAACVAAIVGIALLRLLTTLATPGWASTVIGSLVVIVLQTAVIVLAMAFSLLAGRSQRPIIPAMDAAAFIRSEREDAPAALAPAD